MKRHLIVLAAAAALITPAIAAGQESYTTLSENTWGNEHTSFNFVTIPDWVDSLVSPSSPLVVGVPGRSLAFQDGAEPAILAGLPASGQPAALPDSLGDASVDSTCVLPELLPAHKKGKLKNSLLGETIALALNVRLDPDLIDLDVCSTMMTVAGGAGPDSLYGTVDDTLCAECDTMTIRIPDAVMTAVRDSVGVNPTVGSILDFANVALGGEDTYDASLKNIWHAVKNLNRGFKRCRFLVDCVDDTVAAPVEIIVLREVSDDDVTQAARASGRETALTAMTREGENAIVHYSLPEPGTMDLRVYNVAGREVAVLAADAHCAGTGSIEFPVRGRGLASGVYFVRMQATGAETRTHYRASAKLLVVR